jgi:hypothetical protein
MFFPSSILSAPPFFRHRPSHAPRILLQHLSRCANSLACRLSFCFSVNAVQLGNVSPAFTSCSNPATCFPSVISFVLLPVRSGAGLLFGQSRWRSGEMNGQDERASDDHKPAAPESIIANSKGSVMNGGRRMLLASGQKITIKFSAKPDPPGHHASTSLSGSGQVFLTEQHDCLRTLKCCTLYFDDLPCL